MATMSLSRHRMQRMHEQHRQASNRRARAQGRELATILGYHELGSEVDNPVRTIADWQDPR
ncbi:hypothetical protein C7443_111106 [Plasticicumulans acidivorans]|uniref:Uncharacterized protein n=1 Tax=Plasticicumulans acidivorans TaxID=886464 RepID=A0A317MSA5_9GAMM|nr:hypothetical protein C7443_111106 [Plasticicumulans acidivorans]